MKCIAQRNAGDQVGRLVEERGRIGYLTIIQGATVLLRLGETGEFTVTIKCRLLCVWG